MEWLLTFGKDILKVILWFPRWIIKCRKLMQQEKKESTQAFIENLIHYKESLEKQIPNENDPAKKQALEEELERTIAAERGYYRKILERNLEQSDLPAFDALVASGNIVLKPENKANIAEAVVQLDKLPQPTTGDDFIVSGNAKYYTGQFEKALADYSKALELKPDFAYALYNRGLTYHHLKRYDEALADYNKARELKSDLPEALINRGVTYSKLKRYDKALADYNKVLELWPDYPDALYNLACLFALQNEADKAIPYLEKAIILDVKLCKMAATDSDLDNIHDDPRFKKLIGEK